MINIHDIMETINMISEENLDIRTITMGISLMDCCDSNAEKACEKIYDKISGEEVESLSRRLFLSPSVKNHNAKK